MEPSQVQALQTQVLWAAFGASVVFGAVAQRTHFCTTDAISDIFTLGNWVRMRTWFPLDAPFEATGPTRRADPLQWHPV